MFYSGHSFPIFRALMHFALLIRRLSNTVASTEENIQSFISGIFLTLNTVANAHDLDRSLLPQVLWCTCACLSTTVEHEFAQTIVLLESLLPKIDLNDPVTVDQLLSHRPTGWTDSPFLQPVARFAILHCIIVDYQSPPDPNQSPGFQAHRLFSRLARCLHSSIAVVFAWDGSTRE